MEDLVKLLNGVQQDLLDESRLEAAIQNRGLKMDATPENVGRLRSAGASEQLLRLISNLAPPPPPPPPKGALNVTCFPPECQIRVNGGVYRTTEKGTLRFAGLPIEIVFVDFEKDGYLSRQEKVSIPAERDASLSVTLEPDHATKTKFGEMILASVLTALGAQNTKPGQISVSGSGSASLWDSDGVLTEWDITYKSSEPKAAEIDLRGPPGGFKLSCQAETCEARPAKKLTGAKIKGSEATEISTNLRAFRRYSLAAFLGELTAKGMKPFALQVKPRGSGEQHLQMESGDESYEITLDDELLPVGVTYTSKAGLGSGLHVAYSNYVTVGKMRLPLHIQVGLPDAKQHGISVRLSELTPGANLKDKDVTGR